VTRSQKQNTNRSANGGCYETVSKFIKTLKGSIDLITSHTLTIWADFIKRHRLEKEMRLLSWIAYDEGFKPNLSDLTYRNWERKGITAMCTILTNGNIMSFQDLRETYGYLQLRDYFIREIGSPKILNGVTDVLMRVHNESKIKVASVFYQNLRDCTGASTDYIRAKWERELGIGITPEEWLDMCETPHTNTNS